MKAIDKFLLESNGICPMCRCTSKKGDVVVPEDEADSKLCKCANSMENPEITKEQTPSTMNVGARGGFGAFMWDPIIND